MPEPNPLIASQMLNPMLRIANAVHGRDDIVHLEFGEPNFPTPPHIVAAAQRSLRDERQGYGPGNGIFELREAIAARAERVYNVVTNAECVIATPGGTGAVMCALLTLCSPGDEVLIPDPAWAGYDAMLAISGTCGIRYPLLARQGWLPDLRAVEAAITPHTRVLLLNSPGNPTGAVFPRDIMLQLVGVAERHDLWIVSDECYDEIVFEGEHISPASLGVSDRTITIGTCSKSYAMTGWRVGWAIVPERIARPFALAVTAQINNLPLFVQRAAYAALTGPQECVRDMVAAYRRRRDAATELVQSRGLLDFTPQGAFYLLLPVARAATASDSAEFDTVVFTERLIAEQHIAVAPGIAFGAASARHIRVSLASSDDDLLSAIPRLIDFAALYRG